MSKVYIINDSDHHLYFDNHQIFVDYLIYDIQYTLECLAEQENSPLDLE